jgi:hypothetical protein
MRDFGPSDCPGRHQKIFLKSIDKYEIMMYNKEKKERKIPI